jgi:hypothetical protein
MMNFYFMIIDNNIICNNIYNGFEDEIDNRDSCFVGGFGIS